jgi:hypothetical protein
VYHRDHTAERFGLSSGQDGRREFARVYGQYSARGHAFGAAKILGLTKRRESP